MSETSSTTAKPRRGVMRRKILPGAVVAAAVLGGLEVGFRVVADAHSDPDTRLVALAFSLAAGTLVATLRGA